MAGKPSVNHCQELPSTFWGDPHPPLFLNIRPSCGFRFVNGMEHLYAPFVRITYTGQRCRSFYGCVTIFIVYPKTDGVPLTQRFTGLQLAVAEL